MSKPLGVRIHQRVLRHSVRVARMSTGPAGPGRGELWTCTCKKTWIR
jgi:hypothetical protein